MDVSCRVKIRVEPRELSTSAKSTSDDWLFFDPPVTSETLSDLKLNLVPRGKGLGNEVDLNLTGEGITWL